MVRGSFLGKRVLNTAEEYMRLIQAAKPHVMLYCK